MVPMGHSYVMQMEIGVIVGDRHTVSIKSNQIKFISKCKNSAHRKHVMHLGGTARRIALTAAQCYSFIYK